MQIAVVAPAGGRKVAHDRLVLHAVERHEGQPHRVDDGGRMGYLAAVALRVPGQPAPGRMVRVVVEECGDGVVESVEVVEGDTQRRLPLCPGGRDAEGKQQKEQAAGQTFHAGVCISVFRQRVAAAGGPADTLCSGVRRSIRWPAAAAPASRRRWRGPARSC